MHVEIVTVGDELLLGFTIDSNAAFLARQLAALGITVARHSTCGDDLNAITDTVGAALERSGAVIVTGGLGPTADDLTKAAVARLMQRELVRDESVVRHIEQLWRARGREGTIPETNLSQALVPVGAHVLPNANGTAPGLLLEDERGRWVAMLPGVPREMRALFADALAPHLRARLDRADDATVVRSATLRTTGVPESVVASRLSGMSIVRDGLSLAYLPGVEGVDLRLTARGMPAAEADRALDVGIDTLRAPLGDDAYGTGDADLAGVVLDACRTRALRIAVAESCTGGLLGARITRIPGSSDTFHGGIISYDNRVKRQLLGVLDSDIVEHGAVSEPVALQMAKGVRVRLGTEIGVGVTGIAGPGGGTPDKPVGMVWIAIDVSEGRPPQPRPDGQPPLAPFREARVFQLGGDRDEIRQRAAQAALDMIRRALESQLPVIAL